VRRLAVFSGFVLALCGAALALHDVPTAPTQDDRAALATIAPGGALTEPSTPRSFDAEIAIIRAIQDGVLKAAPLNDGIPLGQPREPKDLIAEGHGLCFDRSRAIEKALTLAGIENRHAFVYAHDGGLDAALALFEPNVPSHAVTEALTRKGWILIDSNARWIGLTASGDVRSLDDLASDAGLAAEAWDADNAEINSIFARPFGYVFGLYSRHGRFYAPYSPIPDLDAAQLHHNLTD
jgi:hypothetical protein